MITAAGVLGGVRTMLAVYLLLQGGVVLVTVLVVHPDAWRMRDPEFRSSVRWKQFVTALAGLALIGGGVLVWP